MEQIRRDYTLNYSIDKIKESIEIVCNNSTGSFQIKSKNEAFNSYSFSFVKMLSVLPVNIQLIKISDEQTRIDLSATPGQSLSRTPTFTNGMLDTFLDLVSKVITGQIIYKPKIITQSDKNKSTFGATLFLIVALIILSLVIYIATR